jgi:hypothetical protein
LLIFVLTACGGGDEGSAAIPLPSVFEMDEPEAPEAPTIRPPLAALPFLAADDAQQSPVFYEGTVLHVGTDVSPAPYLEPVAERPGMFYGRLRDGEGVESVAGYMAEFASIGEFKTFEGHEVFAAPPTVHIAEGASDHHTAYVVRAVQLINENLPADLHVGIGQEVPPLTLDLPEGTIYVDFAPWELWPGERSDGMGMAEHFVSYEGGYYVQYASHVWIEPDDVPDENMLKVIVHELMHALGFKAHISRADTVMPGVGDTFWTENLDDPLYPVDQEGILAAYAHLDPGDTPADIYEKLGGWEDTSTHLMGENQFVRFGAAHRNGFARPWAYGEAPYVNLDAGSLQGEVEWHGDLVGFTPAAEAVAGDASIGVDLGTLTGQADFTSLESWGAGQAPGGVGTGMQWGDGDLGYSIAVNGNTFRQTGGDEGVVTGAFFGPQHEGTGGVLERDDLTAAFGGQR